MNGEDPINRIKALEARVEQLERIVAWLKQVTIKDARLAEGSGQ